ncbi:MAG: SLBB domain-containing protein [Deltaproteobacteria bacterium]|nr:SLBB domain-containing protein [Deltaproteobacteria bacterium]
MLFKTKLYEGRPELEIFGHKLFAEPPSTFAPVKDMPVSEDYVIGPGDEIKILMWGRLDAFHSLVVDAEGVIYLPKIGPLTVAGLTFKEVKELIRAKAEAMTGVNVSISMGNLRSIQVFALGEVRRPGLYTVSSLATVANALLSCGGPTPLGSLRKVELKRNGKLETRIDIYDFLLRGDITDDTRLMPGDVIFVPQRGPMVSVSGQVNRPAIYELKDRQTLGEALRLAGGLRPQAFNRRIQIKRAFQNKFRIVLDISQEELAQSKTIPIVDGDLVVVFTLLPSPVNAVYLYGNVLRPGEYAYKSGLRIRDILPGVDSLEKDTYYPYALVKRYNVQTMESKLIPFNLGRLLLDNDSKEDILLKPLDEVYIFHQSMFEDRPYADVEGEVRNPGRYYIDDMTIKDLIRKAGDLTHNAYLPKAELIRIDEDRRKTTIYFDVAAAMSEVPEHNLRVRDEDRIVIHSVWEEQWREAVIVEGEVKNPGPYALTKGMRLKDLIFKAGNFTRDAYMNVGHLYRTDWRTKDVTIFTFNLEKALSGDPEDNILLKDQDRVEIHSIWEYVDRYNVTIQGMVNKPGDYPYAENMTIADLILVGGNVRRAAFMEKAELIRYDIVEGRKVETSVIEFDPRLALAGDPENNLQLAPMDVVHIRGIPEWFEQKRSVTLKGEVYFPGTYQIRKDERLSSVIERAGGFTEEADLRAAIFTRESVRRDQQQRLEEMVKQLEIEIASASTETTASATAADVEAKTRFVSAQKALLAKLRQSRATGRVVLDLYPLSVLKASPTDIAMKTGDTLLIPEKINTVNVLGAVYNPTGIIYDEKNPQVKYYLGKVGGPTKNAEDGEMYVVRANGSVVSMTHAGSWAGVSWDVEKNRFGFWQDFEHIPLYPGDTIIVPYKVERPDYLGTAGRITTIIYQIAVAAGIIANQAF